MRHFVVPILVEFEMTGSETEMTLWAGTNLPMFKATINGSVVLFKTTWKERLIGNGIVRGFKAYSEGSSHFQEANQDLYPEACLVGSLRLPPEDLVSDRAKTPSQSQGCRPEAGGLRAKL